MIWFTWRQFRSQTAVAAGALAALGVLMFVTGRIIADLYADVAACQTDCTSVVTAFLTKFTHGTGGTAYNVVLVAMYALPGLIGVFWGAPLIARELEAGTHRLVWNQSVTRTRWLLVKLSMGAAIAAVGTGLLSWAVTAWARHVDSAAEDRITPLVFGARGIVPVAYAVFAFLLGVTVGMLIRRTVPAMATTLAIYAAAVAAMPLWLRAHLIPAGHDTGPLKVDNLMELLISGSSAEMEVSGRGVPGAWIVSNRTITTTGATFTGPADLTACGRQGQPGQCEQWLGSLGLRQDLVYHPAGHFWPLQWAEAGVFLGLAALLAGFCFWWIRHRVA
jgi:hypothetical protein